MKEAVEEEPLPKARPRRKRVEEASAPEPAAATPAPAPVAESRRPHRRPLRSPNPREFPCFEVVKGATAQDIAERTDRSPPTS